MHQDANGRWVADSSDENDQVVAQNWAMDQDATKKASQRQPTADEQAQATASATANDQIARWDPNSSSFTFVPMNASQKADNALARSQQREIPQGPNAGGAPGGGLIDNTYLNQAMDRLQTPVTNPALTKGQQVDRIAQALGQRQAFGTPAAFSTSARNNIVQRDPSVAGSNPFVKGFDPTGMGKAGDLLQQASDKLSSGVAPGSPGSEAPVVNRQKIDQILGGLSSYQNKIEDLAGDNTGLSVAEAQLKKATDLANIQAGIDTEASQRSALGAARSMRNRGDRALGERQAIGESAFIGQEAARTAALRRAQNEGDLAALRATEADSDRRFRMDALAKAADLGLNRSALEVDISKTNLDSATNWINQQFNQLGIDKQINQDQAQSLLGFTRDMAAIQQQYDALSVQDQQATDALMMQKYGIDQQTMVALKEIKEKGKFHWDQVLAGVAGGVGTAATAGIAKAAGIG